MTSSWRSSACAPWTMSTIGTSRTLTIMMRRSTICTTLTETFQASTLMSFLPPQENPNFVNPQLLFPLLYSSQQIPIPPLCSSSKRSRAVEFHNLYEKRRRSRIKEKMKALQNLIPNSNKTNKALMLDEAIEYLKQLQLQEQGFIATLYYVEECEILTQNE
ncbi:hypothetical protein GLYMA_17G180800v4 [Glycine max]|uniref:BHLH domain-containing protein n=1 Tax=Glycine max TaxID=3847 RepID=K7MMB3_SOYBN|nr:hypothetical protein JHK86_047826 [Glycine max]KAG4933622.1 hypothetical protein JHK87_047624 [Glycine soja]KAG4943795.1 hypothetical protein JHK85_048441 [Glycine max]KAG5102879.1 hypothetical protein JHK84_047848 [Glycine max]KAH1118986.1 hypothetical protein GYH30_047675 [Glycine max]|eukprot:XP_014624907.1 transcription factor NAI1 isoform X1 [Glycine max]